MKTNTTYFHPIFFPTKVAIIDDDPNYLEQVSLLVNDDVVCDLFTSPSQALQAIQAYEEGNDHFTKQCSHQWAADSGILSRLGIKDNNPHQFIHNDQRFDRFSVMVVDYAMPEMSGLDMCQQLRDPWIKKILITGKADFDVAVQAFNQGIIDQFIRKEEADVDVRLNAAINKLSHQYFTEICTPNNKVLLQEASYLLEDSFIEWFKQLCKEHDVVEYYLRGNLLFSEFLLVNRKGELTLMFFQTPEHAKAQYEISLSVGNTPIKLLNAIHNREVIPYFNGCCVYDTSYKNNWHNYVYATQQFNDYVYAIVDVHDLPDFDIETVGYSYNQFFNDFYALEPSNCN